MVLYYTHTYYASILQWYYTTHTLMQVLITNIYVCSFPWWLSGKEICLPMQEMTVGSLGSEDPLGKEMVTHSSILAWENPMDREAWRTAIHGVANRIRPD